MQINFRHLPVLVLAIFTTFTACKKETKPVDSATELSAHADDQSQVSAQVDAVTNDIGSAIEGSAAYSGKVLNPPYAVSCDASVTFDSTSNPRKVTITYSGSCNSGYTRTGSVVVTMPANVRWKDQGAALTVNYQNLKVTRASDKKSITINGTFTITNLSGGLLYSLATQPSITHTLTSSGMSITFDDNTQHTWQIAKRQVFTYNNGIVLTVTGDHTDGNKEHIAEWGTNRYGHAFTTSTVEPLVIRQDCNFRLTSGEIKHEGFGTATATFGLDVNGNPTTCPSGNGHYYFKLTWTGLLGSSASVILPY
jgi:hypothetical protein